MPRFILLIQVSSGQPQSPRTLTENAARIDAKMRAELPQLKLVQRYVVQNHCDYVDIIEAPSFETAERAVNVVESMGLTVTDLMTATSWEAYEETVRSPRERPDSSVPGTAKPRLDPVAEASEESFPASDAPSWTGIIAR